MARKRSHHARACHAAVTLCVSISISVAATAHCPFTISGASTTASAASDGVLFVRAALGFRDSELTAGSGTQRSASAIITDINSNAVRLDINGSGAFTIDDATIILRYLTGFRGDALMPSGLGASVGATRASGASMQRYIDGGCEPVDPPTVGTTQASYVGSAENFANPERGFAFENDVPWPVGGVTWGFCREGDNFTDYNYTAWNDPLQLAFLTQERAQGRSVVMSRYHIADFRNRDFTQAYFDFLSNDFNVARAAGVKLVVRFAYNYPNGGPDAPLARVLRHIEQLQPLLTTHADVIAYVETGFVGCWGEWNSSSNGLNDDPPLAGHITTAEKQIIDALLNSLPPERMIAQRYPRQKFEYFGSADFQPITPLTAAFAFNGSNRSRVGHHDDCIVCSPSHGGSYNNPRGDLTEVPRFLEQENRYVVQGGEPGDPESIDPAVPANPNSPLASCATILQELSSKRWSVMGLFNIYSPASVIQRWKRDGCHDEIERRLGYRYRLLSSELPVSATSGTAVVVKLTMANDGFANLYNARRFELVLRSKSSAAVVRLGVFEDARLNMPSAGESKTLTFNVPLPALMALGNYDVLLALPDPKPNLYARPEFAIRLANDSMWEASTGFNKLNHTLAVTAPR